MQISNSPVENRNALLSSQQNKEDEEKKGKLLETVPETTAVEAKPAEAQTVSSPVSRTDMEATLEAQAKAEENPALQNQTVSEEDKNSAKEEFLAWVKMDWAERFFASWLSKNGMTKEEFEALPPEEQQKILKAIEEAIEEAIESKAAGTDSSKANAEQSQSTAGNVEATGAAPASSSGEDGEPTSLFADLTVGDKASSEGRSIEDLVIAMVQSQASKSGSSGGPRNSQEITADDISKAAAQWALEKDVDRFVSRR